MDENCNNADAHSRNPGESEVTKLWRRAAREERESASCYPHGDGGRGGGRGGGVGGGCLKGDRNENESCTENVVKLFFPFCQQASFGGYVDM